jgi:zinc and cadmium transporter
VISASTFLVGGVVAYGASTRIDIGFLLPLAAGNFIYVAASDLVPEVNKHHDFGRSIIHLAAFVTGLGLLLLLRVVFES